MRIEDRCVWDLLPGVRFVGVYVSDDGSGFGAVEGVVLGWWGGRGRVLIQEVERWMSNGVI